MERRAAHIHKLAASGGHHDCQPAYERSSGFRQQRLKDVPHAVEAAAEEGAEGRHRGGLLAGRPRRLRPQLDPASHRSSALGTHAHCQITKAKLTLIPLHVDQAYNLTTIIPVTRWRGAEIRPGQREAAPRASEVLQYSGMRGYLNRGWLY